VDDIIVISTNPMSIIEKLRETYILKGVGTPEYYLGGNFHQLKDPILHAMHIKTALSAKTYIGNVLEKFERMFKHPMAEGYHPELDATMLLDDSMSTNYRAIIGSLNWTVILRRFNVMYATNTTLARFSMAPRLGHLEAAKRTLGYLKKYPEYWILLNPNHLDMVKAIETFPEYNSWREFYPEVEEVFPDDKPEPNPGRKAQITVLVDADHAHCTVTRRSVAGVLVFVNSTPYDGIPRCRKPLRHLPMDLNWWQQGLPQIL
jgi:hypothetical protein